MGINFISSTFGPTQNHCTISCQHCMVAEKAHPLPLTDTINRTRKLCLPRVLTPNTCAQVGTTQRAWLDKTQRALSQATQVTYD